MPKFRYGPSRRAPDEVEPDTRGFYTKKQPPPSPPVAIVTAGGTVQEVDDVRTISNISKGAFGIELARQLSARGIRVILIGSEYCVSRLGRTEPFEVLQFGSYQDLERLLNEAITKERPDFIFMAAAISDYSPVRTEGKISSDQEELVIRLEKLPKLLPTLRDKCAAQGLNTFIVGFKLLSGVSEQKLVEVSKGQLRSCRSNLTIANDLGQINSKSGYHPIVMVTPEGGAIPLHGHRQVVITEMLDFVMERFNVRWFKTQMIDCEISPAIICDHHGENLLQFAQAAGLLTDHNGNVALRIAHHNKLILRVSPRGVDKSAVAFSELATVEIDLSRRIVNCYGGRKSSIDTGMQAIVLHNLPAVDALLHFHLGNSIVLPQRTTEFPYPCGTVEEAEQVLAALTGRYCDGEPFAIELINHGYLFGMSYRQVEQMIERWHTFCELYRQHLAEVDNRGDSTDLQLFPVFHGPELIGITGCTSDGLHTLWLSEKVRGKGIGDAVVREMIRRKWQVVTIDACDVEQYYLRYGFQVSERRNGDLPVLIPPTLREDLIHCASITLVHRKSKQVLVGDRLVEPWKGFFCNPGGKLEQCENHWEAAQREFREETGIDLIGLAPIKSTEFFLGSKENGNAYRVVNFLVEAPRLFVPKGSGEIDPHWMQIDAPINAAPATKASLRVATAHFGF